MLIHISCFHSIQRYPLRGVRISLHLKRCVCLVHNRLSANCRLGDDCPSFMFGSVTLMADSYLIYCFFAVDSEESCTQPPLHQLPIAAPVARACPPARRREGHERTGRAFRPCLNCIIKM